jgi:hypothetical protein
MTISKSVNLWEMFESEVYNVDTVIKGNFTSISFIESAASLS